MADLKKWLNAKANSHAREAIFMHRLCFDLQLAAARRGYYLNAYYDDVDHDGFDIIFDDQDELKKVQVKTVGKTNKTRQWEVRKGLLRPRLDMIEKVGFEASAIGEGAQGGFIVMKYDDTAPENAVEYSYTDLFVLLAFTQGVISRATKKSQTAIHRCFKQFKNGLGKEKLLIPAAAMLVARDTDNLLALMGMHSQTSSSWTDPVIRLANDDQQHPDPKLPLVVPADQTRKYAAESIKALIVDTTLN